MAEIVEVKLFRPTGSEHWEIVRAEDETLFAATQPYGYTRGSGHAIVVDGEVYLLREDSPAEPVTEWSPAALEAREAERDAVLAALTPSQRAAIGEPHWEPFPVRRAQRIADDADATVRQMEARGDNAAQIATKRAEAEQKRAEVEAERAKRRP